MRVVLVERTRPVVANRTNFVEPVVPTVARSGQEETIAVARSEEYAFHTVLGRPNAGRVIEKFLPFILGGHAPAIAPIGRSGIVIRLDDFQIVNEAVVAIIGLGAILGQLVILAIAVPVSAPVIGGLGFRLPPSEIVAITFRSGRTHVAGGPQGTARQAKVNILVIFVLLGSASHCEHHRSH